MTTRRQRLAGRAGHRCESRNLHSAIQHSTYHTDRVHPASCGRADDDSNRAGACPMCNQSKSNRLTLIDPGTGEAVPFFNSRRDTWTDHFRFDGYFLTGRMPTGRAMIAALDLTETQCVFIRSIKE